MTEYPGVHLRVDPQAIPRLRAGFRTAIDMLQSDIEDLGLFGWLDGAWMGDPTSAEVAAFYNERVMAASDGPYQALVLYLKELNAIVERLDVIEREYRRTETGNVGVLGGGAA
jgi:hypothetical protein